MVDMSELAGELRAEHARLAEHLERLSEVDWARTTPAPRWTVAHQVAHLTFFDQMVQEAVADPERFRQVRASAAAADAEFGEKVLVPYLALSSAALFEVWQASSAEAVACLEHAPAGLRVPWFGPAMSVASKLTARLMETWAHGQDILDAVGATRVQSDALRHIADLAVRARPYSYLNRDLPPSSSPVRVELRLPSGRAWTSGPASASDLIRGEAEQFCLVLTRRRHVADTDLETRGPAAIEWMTIGQAYAGDPGPGRAPGHHRGLLQTTDATSSPSTYAGDRGGDGA